MLYFWGQKNTQAAQMSQCALLVPARGLVLAQKPLTLQAAASSLLLSGCRGAQGCPVPSVTPRGWPGPLHSLMVGWHV